MERIIPLSLKYAATNGERSRKTIFRTIIPSNHLFNSLIEIKQKEERLPIIGSRSVIYLKSVATAAAEDKNKSNDYYPDAVVIKEIAQAVIHIESSLQSFEGI